MTSENDSGWVDANASGLTSRTSDPASTSMYLSMERSFNSCAHNPETVDWIAFDETHMTTNGIVFDSVKTDDSVACCSAVGYAVDYSSPFAAVPTTIMV